MRDDVFTNCCQAFIRALPLMTKPNEQLLAIYALRCFARQAGGDVLDSEATIYYSDTLCSTVFLVHPLGSIEMLDDHMLAHFQ